MNSSAYPLTIDYNEFVIFPTVDSITGPCIKLKHNTCGWIEKSGYWEYTVTELRQKIRLHILEGTCVPKYEDAT